MERILISGCLTGKKVRYDGKDNECSHLLMEQWKAEGRLISICPEVAGGLAVPREPAAIIGLGGGEAVLKGYCKVETHHDIDVTEAYIKGAQAALELAKQHNIKVAILKERSPSCGSTAIYAGDFSGKVIPGEGVTAALLHLYGIKIFNETQLPLVADYINLLEKVC